MTRKDYIVLAEALRVQYRRASDTANSCTTDKSLMADGFVAKQTVLEVASELADSLKGDNSRFNREHFLSVVRGEKELHSRPARKARQS